MPSLRTTSGLVALVLLLGACAPALGQDGDTPPHIVFIVADDLGYKDVGYNGAEFVTPVIDTLAEEGVILDNYYVHQMCSPTRSAMLTGRYSWKLGIPGAFRLGVVGHLPPDELTVADMLRGHGYATHYVGKWHAGYPSFDLTPKGRGFDTFYGIFQGETDYWTHTLPLAGGYDFWDGDAPDKSAIGTYATDLYVQRVEDILTAHDADHNGEPLFLSLNFQIPHAPLQMPPGARAEQCRSEFVAGEGRALFCEMVLYMDTAIGAIRTKLEELHMWEDTVVVFSTDNGGIPNHNDILEQGSEDPHGVSSYACNLPYRGGKRTNFEGGLKAVAFISGGGLDSAIADLDRSDLLLHAVDWLPTLVEGFAQFPVKLREGRRELDGANMVPALRGDAGADWTRQDLFLHIEDFGANAAMIHGGRWKYIKGWQDYTRWYHCHGMYPHNVMDLAPDPTVDHADVEEWLFDLQADPTEQFNLAHRDAVQQLKADINALITEQVFKTGEYVTPFPNDLREESYHGRYCGVWYPWLDWDGSLSCAQLNAQARGIERLPAYDQEQCSREGGCA